jgi:hypothetical protein
VRRRAGPDQDEVDDARVVVVIASLGAPAAQDRHRFVLLRRQPFAVGLWLVLVLALLRVVTPGIRRPYARCQRGRAYVNRGHKAPILVRTRRVT